MNTLILISVLVAGVILGSVFHFHKKRSILLGGKWKISKQTREKVENKDIQELLKVSDSTVVRYLDELEEEKKIKQIGKTGNAVYYQLK